MKGGNSPLVAIAAWIALVAPSCAGTDVILATLPAEEEASNAFEGGDTADAEDDARDASAAGDASEAGNALHCKSRSDCLHGLYCEKTACNAPSGTCQLFPAECSNDENPVCGCDGMTYFNECLRQAHAVPASSPGQCQPPHASTCGGSANTVCPGTAVCALLGGVGGGPATCSTDAEGSCWVLPDQCPSSNLNEWDSCLSGDAGSHCLGTCEALRRGGSYARASSCHGRDE